VCIFDNRRRQHTACARVRVWCLTRASIFAEPQHFIVLHCSTSCQLVTQPQHYTCHCQLPSHYPGLFPFKLQARTRALCKLEWPIMAHLASGRGLCLCFVFVFIRICICIRIRIRSCYLQQFAVWVWICLKYKYNNKHKPRNKKQSQSRNTKQKTKQNKIILAHIHIPHGTCVCGSRKSEVRSPLTSAHRNNHAGAD
jgi:hypothetical protein